VAFIAVKDTDAAVATAIARGGRIASPAKDSSSGRIVVIADPWGATLGLVGPAAKT
jgi:predicted enzyme related to lactoylglutathione lyase